MFESILYDISQLTIYQFIFCLFAYKFIHISLIEFGSKIPIVRKYLVKDILVSLYKCMRNGEDVKVVYHSFGEKDEIESTDSKSNRGQ
jgi:hypothetical protein